MRAGTDFSIRLKETLSGEDCLAISTLAGECTRHDGAGLKLELDYKLGTAAQSGPRAALYAVNELMYFESDRLIGYIGICCFGGAGAPMELNGMVHPAYRRRGVFQTLSALALTECRRRGAKSILLLCDRQSPAGRGAAERTGAKYHHSEFEMYLRDGKTPNGRAGVPDVVFEKARNEDAAEIARQNAIYFGNEGQDVSDADGALQGKEADTGERVLPEEEEKRGMTIYLIRWEGRTAGKVHVQLCGGTGGIYGLGVLPEYRGTGLGRAALMGAVQKLKEAGAGEIMLQVAANNKNALRLYESCGFVAASTMDYYELAL